MKSKTYFLSFVEECIMDPAYFDYVGGRIEVHEVGAEKYAIEEIRFLTNKLSAYHKLRAKWDFEDATSRQLNRLKKDISNLNENKKS
jgi:hypothetical protein